MACHPLRVEGLGRPALSSASTDTPAEASAQLWLCAACGFVYDPAEGDPDGGIPPGTAFEDIPDDWFCPVCGARKTDFEPLDAPSS